MNLRNAAAARAVRTTRPLLAAALFLCGHAALGMAKPDPQMRAVLQSLAELHPKPIEKLNYIQARKQPGPADAVKRLLKKQGKSTAPQPVGSVADRTVPGPGGPIPVRIYTPNGTGPFPVAVYFHGGGFVIAGIQAYDASCRALTNAAQAIVVSVGYRLAPEHKFPAAPNDAYAATQWVFKNAGSFNGDPRRVAVVGESAGGNLATVVCLMARDKGGKMPLYQVLVYPVTTGRADLPSDIENAKAKPLDRAMLPWFFHYYLPNKAAGKNPYAAPILAKSMKGLPPATIINAQIDPLRDDGALYAAKLRDAGIPVRRIIYTGVTHEFFGMGAVLDKAKQANQAAATALKGAFGRHGSMRS